MSRLIDMNPMTHSLRSICIGICLLAASCGSPSQKTAEAAFTDCVAEALARGGQQPDEP